MFWWLIQFCIAVGVYALTVEWLPPDGDYGGAPAVGSVLIAVGVKFFWQEWQSSRALRWEETAFESQEFTDLSDTLPSGRAEPSNSLHLLDAVGTRKQLR